MRSSRLTVEREGILPLPAAVCEAVGLQPGDILAIEVLEESFVLEAYRELLASLREHTDRAALRSFAIGFLSRPLTALEPGGHVRIPEEVFPLPAGSVVSLHVDGHGGRHSLQAFVE